MIEVNKNSVFIYPKDEWILDVGCYFEILKKINYKLIELLKCDTTDFIEEKFFELSTELNRIIPIGRKRSINPSDGILELNCFIDFLLDDYNKMFDDYNDFIITTNFIRHKYQHAPHTIKMKEYSETEKIKKIEFVYLQREKNLGISFGKGLYSIDTNEMIKVVIRLNEIFKKIKDKFYQSAQKRDYDLKNCFFSSIVNFDDEYLDRFLKKYGN